MTLRFYANDSLGHLGFKDVTIWKDLISPQITINSPTPNQLCGVVAPSFSLIIVEPNIQTKRYSLNGRPNITFTTETGVIDQDAWTDTPEGEITITFYAIDKSGNIGYAIITVIKNIPLPPAISGYNVSLLVGILSVAIIIISKKRRNRFRHKS